MTMTKDEYRAWVIRESTKEFEHMQRTVEAGLDAFLKPDRKGIDESYQAFQSELAKERAKLAAENPSKRKP